MIMLTTCGGLRKNLFLAVINKHAQIKKRRTRNKKSPWLNKKIKQQMFARDKLQTSAVETDSPEL